MFSLLRTVASFSMTPCPHSLIVEDGWPALGWRLICTAGPLIKQIPCAAHRKRCSVVLPARGYTPGIYTCLNGGQRRLVEFRWIDGLQGKVPRIEFPKRGRNFHPKLRRIKSQAIANQHADTVAALSVIAISCGRHKALWEKTNAGDMTGIQESGEFSAAHPGSSKPFKRSFRAPSYANVCFFQQADARVECG